MSEQVSSLLRQNLFSVFGERDQSKRKLVIEKIWAQEGVFTDPEGVHIGHAEIDAAVGALLEKFPEFVFTEIGDTDEIPGAGRLAWGFGPPGGLPAVTGLDVIVVTEGRITALYTFLDAAAR
jgi:hypothetical protein